MTKFYTKGKGRKSALERSMINDIETIIEQHDVDMSEFKPATNPNELEDLRNNLVEKYGSPKVEKKDTTSSQAEPSQEETDPGSSVEEETESFEQPSETTDADLPSTETSGEETWQLSDFKEVKDNHPFSQPFKEEDMFKASRYMDDAEDTPSGDVEEIDPTQHMERSQPTTDTEESDSVENPWERRRPAQPQNDTTEVAPPQPSNNNDAPLSEEEKKKVKLANSTGKKASEMLAKQVTNLTCSALEGGAKWYGKLPVTEKKLKKLEATGKLDRHFVVDKATQKTFNHIVDEHKQFLDEVIKIEADQKEDLMKAIMLVAEKHDVQVSPESNLMMVLLNIVITIGQASHQQKKKMERLITKISDQYVLESQRIAPLENENAELKAQLRVLQGGGQPTTQPTVATEDQNDAEPWTKKLKFGESGQKEIKELGSRTEQKVETASNEIETITSEVEGDNKPQKFKKVDLTSVKA
jgi:hypothetical protein